MIAAAAETVWRAKAVTESRVTKADIVSRNGNYCVVFAFLASASKWNMLLQYPTPENLRLQTREYAQANLKQSCQSMCEHVVLTCWLTADNYFHGAVRFGHKVSHRLPNWEQLDIPYPRTLVMRADRVETGPTLTFGTTGQVGGSWDLARLQC
ncbi:hypothetical protein IRJ41_003729 [Triplophysa rosa]|uniref:Uncharacterized protein n=1 Tax=Triplophysa rosa TaxID=992332 RepID=A0A9W7WD79_TRIRA|nr:hypothetical protein IRJ41_003729 [Triplophysa rosa]